MAERCCRMSPARPSCHAYILLPCPTHIPVTLQPCRAAVQPHTEIERHLRCLALGARGIHDATGSHGPAHSRGRLRGCGPRTTGSPATLTGTYSWRRPRSRHFHAQRGIRPEPGRSKPGLHRMNSPSCGYSHLTQLASPMAMMAPMVPGAISIVMQRLAHYWYRSNHHPLTHDWYRANHHPLTHDWYRAHHHPLTHDWYRANHHRLTNHRGPTHYDGFINLRRRCA